MTRDVQTTWPPTRAGVAILLSHHSFAVVCIKISVRLADSEVCEGDGMSHISRCVAASCHWPISQGIWRKEKVDVY